MSLVKAKFRNWCFEPVTSLEMAVIDRNAEYLGISRMILMENAGKAIAEEVYTRWGRSKNILTVAGLGDNGGDGLVASRYLANWGFNVKVILLGRERDIRSELTLKNYQILKYLHNVKLIEITTPLELLQYEDIFKQCDIIIDAIIGTGIKGSIREPQATAIELINLSKAKKVAVDVPSGLDPDTGNVVDIAVKADLTITMHRPKRGFFTELARKYLGELVIVDIGIPREAELIVGPGDMLYLKYSRRRESKKGDHGRVVIIGGSREFSGAPALTAYAALRMGIDLAIILAPEKTALSIKAQRPDFIAIPLEGDYLTYNHINEILKYCERANIVILGPGVGTRDETVKTCIEILEKIVPTGKYVIIDADGIKALALTERYDLVKSNVILTPHEGEFKLLTKESLPKDLLDKIEKFKEIVRSKFQGGTILLKGNVDLVSNGYKVKINYTGNPGMTIGGTGDVLTGIVAGVLRMINEPVEAAAIGAFITGLAGDLSVRELGYHILPTDIIEKIPIILKNLINIDEEIDRALHVVSRNFLKKLLK